MSTQTSDRIGKRHIGCFWGEYRFLYRIFISESNMGYLSDRYRIFGREGKKKLNKAEGGGGGPLLFF